MIVSNSKFQETKIGKAPKEWKIRKIVDLFEIKTGTTPSTKQKEYWNNGHINWITPADMSKLNGKLFIENSERKITEKGLRETNLTLMPNGSIVISTRAPVGYVAIVKGKATFNQGCKGLIPKSLKEINSIFYAYYLLSKKTLLEHSSSGSTFKELSKKALEDFIIPLPPLPEQERIVETLLSLDKAIEEVDESITGIKRLKKGLIRELLSKGIGHNEFKETEIGKIPEAWRVVKVTNIGSVISGFGFPTEYQGKKNGEYIFVKVSDTNLNGNEKYILTTKNTIDNKLTEKIGVKICPSDTIVFPKIGMVIYLRKVRILAKAGTFDNNMMGIIPNKDIVDPEFFFYYFLEKIDLTKLCGRTTAPSIRKSEVEKLSVSLPPIPEQKKIGGILLVIDKRLELLREKKERLGKIKRGLMEDLLTGKKRVKVVL